MTERDYTIDSIVRKRHRYVVPASGYRDALKRWREGEGKRISITEEHGEPEVVKISDHKETDASQTETKNDRC